MCNNIVIYKYKLCTTWRHLTRMQIWLLISASKWNACAPAVKTHFHIQYNVIFSRGRDETRTWNARNGRKLWQWETASGWWETWIMIMKYYEMQLFDIIVIMSAIIKLNNLPSTSLARTNKAFSVCDNLLQINKIYLFLVS